MDSLVVSRRGLLGVEGFAVRARFDPDRSTQRTVLAAVNRHECYFSLEVADPPSPGFCRSHASDYGVALHRLSLQAHCQPGLFNSALRPCDGTGTCKWAERSAIGAALGAERRRADASASGM